MTEKLTLAQRVVRAVCELGDTPAPECADTLLVKSGDLEAIIDEHLERWLLKVYDTPQTRMEGWHDGAPGKPWANEWFIAETTYGDRVVLTALPEEWAYDFKTADDTYIKADKIKRWMQFPDSQYISPADTDAAQSEAEAFDTIVAARKAYVDAVAVYNARLEFVRAERECGNWLNVDPEYAAMSEAQSAFYRTVQDLADAAIRQRAEEKP